MKAKEHIYNLRDNLSVANSSLADKTDQHIMYMLDEARSILISRKVANRHNIDNMTQYFDTAPMLGKNSDSAVLGCKEFIKVTTPKPVTLNRGIGILTVGGSDVRAIYAKIDYSRIRIYMHRKYTGNATAWIYENNSILIVNSLGGIMENVRVRGLFDEPHKVETLKGKVSLFDPFDFEYPLSLKDSNAVYDIAMAGDLSWGDISIQTIAKRNQEAANRAKNR